MAMTMATNGSGIHSGSGIALGHGLSHGHFAEDTLDSPNFDPIAFINQKFPNESSLNEIDTFVVGIGCKITTLEDEISKAVQAQSRAGEQATKVPSITTHHPPNNLA
jgi:vacuolar protein sorting-associated protein 53